MSRQSNFFQNALFKPSKIRDAHGKSLTKATTLADTYQDSIGSVNVTSSFRFDSLGEPLKNTQQLNVDFSKLKNHCFFNSAKNKAHVAIDKIINQFPFDGSRSEFERFFDSLSGYEKYIFSIWPKNVGSLLFERSSAEDGNFISIKDYKGTGKSDYLNQDAGSPVLDFGSGPFSFEMSLFVPSGSVNNNEIVAQRVYSGSHGITLAISSSKYHDSSIGKCEVLCIIGDGTKSIQVSASIDKGKYHHIGAVYDRGSSDKIKLYIDAEKVSESKQGTFGNFDFVGSSFTIGSGSTHSFKENSTDTFTNFTPTTTLSGSIDEFRFFHSARTRNDIQKYRNKEIFAQPDLKLYYRFNEPSGSYVGATTNQSLILDHSGNGLHVKIENFSMGQRNRLKIENIKALKVEDPEMSPILFPSFNSVKSLSLELITSASTYDYNNPNVITKLVPQHYLQDAEYFEGLESEVGGLESLPGIAADEPGGSRIQQAQLITSILYMWAEIFDEMKMYVDEFGRLLTVDYRDENTINSQFLPFLSKYHGFTLPAQFNAANIEQFLQGKNLSVNDVKSNRTLQTIQNTIWRRILADLPHVRKTKGTRASIESVLRNIGINPGTTFRIREYGGSSTKEIKNFFERRTEVSAMLDFSGSLSKAGPLLGDGSDGNRPLLRSSFLTASRIEPGWPWPAGNDGINVHHITGTNNVNDRLLTSGSWTVEGLFKFEGSTAHNSKQSLIRLQTTGSSSGVKNNWALFNVIAHKEDKSAAKTGSIELYAAPGPNTTPLRINIENINIFDSKKWYISFGRNRNDENKNQKSSYFLRVGRSRTSLAPLLFSTSSYVNDQSDNALTTFSNTSNSSGSFIAVGSMSLGFNKSSSINHLNRTSYKDAAFTFFDGKAAQIRFYSKGLTESESKSHIRNFKSIGVFDPSKNFNFVSQKTGSFEKLRLDLSLDQNHTRSNPQKSIHLIDFSQNNLHGNGTGFESKISIIKPERFDYESLLPKIELGTNENKIRVRSLKNVSEAVKRNVDIAPTYEIPGGEEPKDDRRAEIEISAVQAINDDIMLIFSSLEFFDNAIGDPELVFASDYSKLRDMRRIYFNRLEEKMSLSKFFQFFKWFDDSVGDIIEELIPRSTRYLGTNFVIESHSLERAKFPYSYTDMYMGELERPANSSIFVQQFIGKIKKF